MTELRYLLKSTTATYVSVLVAAISIYFSIVKSDTFFLSLAGTYLALSIASVFIKVLRPFVNIITAMIILQKIFWFVVNLFDQTVIRDK